MFWMNRIAEEIANLYKEAIKGGAPLIIRDEKTPSGRSHLGSMRGVAIHGAISEALTDIQFPNIFRYEFNDMDPMDAIPTYLDRDTYEPHLGKSLKDIPSPDPSAKTYAEFFANDFKRAIQDAGFTPEYYWASDLYLSGKMDELIYTALKNADTIRTIYKEVSGSDKKEGWLPIFVVCPQCKKITTAVASDFDEETVLIKCREHTVDYTTGCGFEGRVSPFGGNAKLPWKVEWAAKWKVNNVLVEGGGKDHATKGGSRDVAIHISREVFKYEPPFDIPYEFLLAGGQKMSSSKGKGSFASQIASLVPTKIFRLSLLGKDYNQQINFDPEGDTIPVLFDQYDKLADGYKTNKEDDYARLFEYVHPNRQVPPEDVYYPRFSQVAFMVQMPHLNIEEEFARMKGSTLTVNDKKELTERADYAKRWLEKYAPEKFVFKIQETTPEEAKKLSDIQKKALAELCAFIESAPAMPSGEDIHHKLHEMKEGVGIEPAQLFSAIYLSILGKAYGPKAGWFISVLDKDFVVKRLKEVTQ